MLRLSLLLSIALCTLTAVACAQPATAPQPPAADRPFADVPRDHWAYEAVEELRKRGILRGYPPAGPRAAPVKEGSSSGKGRTGKPAPRRRQSKGADKQ
jgi:hypothetical protein